MLFIYLLNTEDVLNAVFHFQPPLYTYLYTGIYVYFLFRKPSKIGRNSVHIYIDQFISKLDRLQLNKYNRNNFIILIKH